jgi:flagellar biosynthesis/type III secretory pathway M-ring protein FliF/YscJ
MNFIPVLTDAQKNAPTVRFGARFKQSTGAAVLAFSLNLPALAEKIEATGAAKSEHPANEALLAVFSGLNVIAGVAILATIIFSVIWFLQRRDEDDEEEDDEEEELEEKAAENAAHKAEAKSEVKSEEKATEITDAKSGPEAAAEDVSAAKDESGESAADKSEDAAK